ncbi:MAG: lipid-A-disaccharide synthase [Hyphomicrobiales bacterium]|nr:lipid-A-disaccharide synthase [Hyphomicrobiales bacterium]
MNVFVVAGEKSGDLLGAKLMQALRRLAPDVALAGVGGEAMAREGLRSLFPIEDIAVMGVTSILTHLPRILARIDFLAREIVKRRPDVLVIIDSPDFTHRVARRVRKAAPDIPIVDYVSPTVWAWRPGRAKAMRAYVDRVLALFPFEPAAHERLGGPPCVFVGHPLVEHLDELRPDAEEARARESEPSVFLLMPGSRRSEIARLMPPFGQVLHRVAQRGRRMDVILPAVAHLEADIREELRSWPYKPEVVVGDAAKLAAFRRARVALVASGTATLELALAGVPMAVAYKVSRPEALLKFLVDVPSIVLANLVIGRNVVPEFLQADCNPDALTRALAPLFAGGCERDAQLSAFAGLPALLTPAGEETPSAAAARNVLEAAQRGRTT